MNITHHAANMRLDWPSPRVLRATFGGPLSFQTLRAFKRARIEAAQYDACVCDFRGAALLVTVGDFGWLLQGESEDTQAGKPTALVCRADCLAMFVEHGARQALRGITRRAFLDPTQAVLWAAAHATSSRRSEEAHQPQGH